MRTRNRTVQLAGSEIDCSSHACAFFHSSADENRILLPFVKDGVEAGDKIFQIVDKERSTERQRYLLDSGIDLNISHTGQQIEIRSWEQAYLRGSRFDQEAMLALIQEILIEGRQAGFGLTRLWANMEWALEDLPGIHDIVEYEARLNYILPQYDDVVVCTYDVTRFSASVVMDIMRTHPKVIIGGILQENPFYVSPDLFLEELRGRRASQTGS